MAKTSRKYLLNSDARVFIREKSDCCPIAYDFYNCMRLDGIQKSFGEPTSQFCPSPDRAGEFIEVATIEAAETRVSTSLVGRIPLSYDSIIYDLAQKSCEFDLQVHFGVCSDLTNFDEFESAIILENVTVSSYSTDQLGALSPDENALVNETIAITAGNWYSIRQLQFTNIGINGPLADPNTHSYFNSLTCSPEGCVSCCDDDCLLFVLVGNFALDRQEVWVSKNLGRTWLGPNIIPLSTFATMTGTLEVNANNTSLVCDGDDLLIGSAVTQLPSTQQYPRVWRATKQDMLDVTSNFTTVWTNNVITGTIGYPSLTKFKEEWYTIRQRTLAAAEAATVFVGRIFLDGSNQFISVYNPNIHGASDRPDRNEWAIRTYNDEVMLVGVESVFDGTNQAYFAFSYDGYTWEEVLMTLNGQPVIGQRTRPIPVGKNKWLIHVSSGDGVTARLFCTLDGGKTFSVATNSPTGLLHTVLNNNIAYSISGGSNLRTRFFRSYNGGLSAKLMPEDGVTQLPDIVAGSGNADVNFCGDDPNFVILGHPGNGNGNVYRSGSLWRAN